jgi:hypothetical protein
MPGQQAQQLAARVTAGPRYRNPRAHLGAQPLSPSLLEEYSLYSMNMQERPRVGVVRQA